MELKLLKVIDTKNTYVGRDNKTYPRTNYYLVTENGKNIPVKPSFPTDYSLFDLIADKKEI